MRWLGRRKIPKFLSIIIVLLLVAGGLKIGIELIQLSSRQVLGSNTEFFSKAEAKLADVKIYLSDSFDIEIKNDKNFLGQFFEKENLGSTIGFLNSFLTSLLMTVFFVVLWLAESINVHKLLNNTLLRRK
jgi:predicted PurR-regulated permease PerM